MTPKYFSSALVSAYQRARQPMFQHDKLGRGESRSVASEIEDLLALYLVENLPKIDSIRINQPMTFIFNKLKKNIKPDLVVIQDGSVRAFVDLKMDLGYKRDTIASTVSKANCHLKAMQGQTVSFWLGKRAAGGIQHSIPVASDATYHFVVVTDQNINKSAYSKVEAKVRRFRDVSLHTLVREVHPNDYALSKSELNARCVPYVTAALPEFEAAIARAMT